MAVAGFSMPFNRTSVHAECPVHQFGSSVRFLEAAFMAGLDSTDWTWTTKFGDFDQDGLQDVYFTNGMSRDWFNGDHIAAAKEKFKLAGGEKEDLKLSYKYWFDTPRFELENLAFRNAGDLKFEDVSSQWGFDHKGVSTGSATADLDLDGDLDIIVNGFDEPLKIYRNDIGGGNSIKVYLRGTKSNRFALGAKLEIEYYDSHSKPRKQIRYLNSTQGIMSSSENVAHFGVGDGTTIDTLSIRWPSGIQQQLSNINVNQTLVVTEPNASQQVKPIVNSRHFRPVRAKLNSVRHQETPFDDFQHQPLIPNKYSQLGPGHAWADIDNDGDYDCFQGGGKGQSGTMVEFKDGDWNVTTPAAFELDQDHEDMGSLFFDADTEMATLICTLSAVTAKQPRPHGRIRIGCTSMMGQVSSPKQTQPGCQ